MKLSFQHLSSIFAHAHDVNGLISFQPSINQHDAEFLEPNCKDGHKANAIHVFCQKENDIIVILSILVHLNFT